MGRGRVDCLLVLLRRMLFQFHGTARASTTCNGSRSRPYFGGSPLAPRPRQSMARRVLRSVPSSGRRIAPADPRNFGRVTSSALPSHTALPVVKPQSLAAAARAQANRCVPVGRRGPHHRRRTATALWNQVCWRGRGSCCLQAPPRSASTAECRPPPRCRDVARQSRGRSTHRAARRHRPATT